jgi:hypothetical protein
MNIEFLNHRILNFPSGSAIEKHNDFIYLIGDDATEVLILNFDFSVFSKISISNYKGDRIPKPLKHDFEMATIIDNELLILGSGSLSTQRENLVKINLDDHKIESINLSNSFNFLRNQEIAPEINLEALTFIHNKLWLFNRANLLQKNTLLIVNISFLKNERFEFQKITIKDYFIKNIRLGISGATYCEENNLLFVTLSAENTENAYDDGEILGSAIGISKNPIKQLSFECFEFDKIIILADYFPIFAHQKIESICVISVVKNTYHLLLVADNDNGNSELFELLLTINT